MPLNEAWNGRRIIFTDNQRNELVRVFEETPYPGRNKLEELAQIMGVSFDSIRKWFQSTRTYNPNKSMPSLPRDHHKTEDSESDCKSKKEKPLKIASPCTRYTVDQRNELMRVLEETRYPNRKKMVELAQRMGVPFHKISMWFRNTRRTERSRPKSSSTRNRQELTVCSESVCKSGKKKPLKTVSYNRRFTIDQRKELVRVFEETPYPRRNKMEELAQRMGVSFHSITKWFQNTRTYNPNKIMPSSSHDCHENVSSESDRRSETKIIWGSKRTFTDVQRNELIRETVDSDSDYRSGMKNLLETASRRTFTDDERNELVRVFEKIPYPRRNKMEKLAQRMEMPFHNINSWFKNTRRYNREKIDLLKGRIKIEHSYCKSETIQPMKIALRRRKKFTDNQRNELALVLKETPYPRRNKMEELAQKMGVSFNNINMWFRNIRRSKLNKLYSSSFVAA